MNTQSGALTRAQAKERLAQVVKQSQEAQAARTATAEQRYEEAARPAWLLMRRGTLTPAEAAAHASALRIEAIVDDAEAAADGAVAIAAAARDVVLASSAPVHRHRWMAFWKCLLPPTPTTRTTARKGSRE